MQSLNSIPDPLNRNMNFNDEVIHFPNSEKPYLGPVASHAVKVTGRQAKPFTFMTISFIYQCQP